MILKMKYRILSFRCLIALVIISSALAASFASAATKTDRVRLTRGSESGEITETSPFEVTIDKGTGNAKKIAVNEIRSVILDGEPTELTQGRINAKNGGYSTALETLKKIDASKIDRELIREEIEFYVAFCAGKNALAGTGDLLESGRQLNEFVRAHPKSFHYLDAVETMADLLVVTEKYPAAQKQYEELAKAPWPDYKMRASILVGRTLQAQGKHDDAIRQFDVALADLDEGEAAQGQKQAATLGKAVSLTETKKIDEAVRLIEEVIQNTDPEQKELQARAYNALGACYERADRAKDALLAFLHVDVLYSSEADAHAEALSHLAKLWKTVGHDEQGRKAQQVLQEKYGKTKWAKL